MSAPSRPPAPDGSAGVTLLLPGELRDLAGGESAVQVPGYPATVGEALGALRTVQPAVYRRLLTEQGELRPHINVFVDREDVRLRGGLAAPLAVDSEVLIVRSVSGG